MKSSYVYSTERLIIKEWHSLTADEWQSQDISVVVKNILTPSVTKTLPPFWQGAYTLERAKDWITELEDEGVVLLVVEQSSGNAIGMVILFESGRDQYGTDLRLGYILAEASWGKGYASELVNGFAHMSKINDIKSITGGVDQDNIASRRVLEKCGFILAPSYEDSGELLYVLQFPYDV